MMSQHLLPPSQGKTARTTLSSNHAITLPAHVVQELGIEPGDDVEVVVEERHLRLQRVAEADAQGLRGLLAEYFLARDDVRDFGARERTGGEPWVSGLLCRLARSSTKSARRPCGISGQYA